MAKALRKPIRRQGEECRIGQFGQPLAPPAAEIWGFAAPHAATFCLAQPSAWCKCRIVQTDHELLAAWQAGDKAAGEALVGRHFHAVCRFFRAKLGDDVGDLIGQTFLDCVAKKDTITESFPAFLFTIARARLLDHLRRNYRRGPVDALSDHSLADLGASPRTSIARNQSEESLLRALAQLPVDTQILLELTYWENLSAPDVGTVLGIPANTVRGQLSRARERLRELMTLTEEASVQTLSEFAQ